MEKFSDIHTERAVIGSILIAGDDYSDIAISAVESLTENDFSSVAHRLILRGLKKLNVAGSKFDLVLLNSELEQSGDSGHCGGFAYIAECAKNVPSISLLPSYVDKLKQLSMTRQMLSVLHSGIARITQGGISAVQDIAGDIENQISNLGSANDGGTAHIMAGVEESIEIIESMINGDIWKYKTVLGMPDIDKAFGGFNNTDFIVVGGRPGTGKTLLSTAITKSVALKNRKPVMFFSMEMPTWQISERITFHHAHIRKEDLLGENSTKEMMNAAWGKLGHALNDVQTSPIYINDKTSVSINEIRAEARRMHKQTGGLGVIIVDYLQIMKMSNPDNMNQSVGEIATGLKNLAKELKCPVIALAQLNRNLEQRANKRPMNSDLRESGVIEQVADVIFMVYRDEKYNSNTEMKGITEIICTKSRHAPGAEKTYYFTHTRGGLDPADFTRVKSDKYQEDIEF
ncbi:replicative DNA helicase [Xenorhabdus hominickii]|uniref:DNA 5'-3' helicase n=1 Tax=Xenorhabdus hominickii TaxID=351679 RepID=A0A2G0QBB8_XENHO|nr:replicative DNA helicase [Xenorhabdus hominickii]AOM40522.1 DNA helicase [Xenorhabdus hominickii]PHM56535.1 DNA helicase [Xenorhabdus hominickii]